jgi:hypothetical protein
VCAYTLRTKPGRNRCNGHSLTTVVKGQDKGQYGRTHANGVVANHPCPARRRSRAAARFSHATFCSSSSPRAAFLRQPIEKPVLAFVVQVASYSQVPTAVCNPPRQGSGPWKASRSHDVTQSLAGQVKDHHNSLLSQGGGTCVVTKVSRESV